MSEPITDDAFEEALSVFETLKSCDDCAVFVSGGPDSLALAYLLDRWGQKHDKHVHAITFDHGLRPESANEARHVADVLKDFPKTSHVTLQWQGEKPETRIMERAREARYSAAQDYMQGNGIKHLFTGHHLDDQAETVLIRLCKGSGLDGLSAMRPVSDFGEGMHLCRPLLGFEKDRLIATCKAASLPYIEDPSNHNDAYLRPRFREAREILEAEGLSNQRLAVTAARMARARDALEAITQRVYDEVVTQNIQLEIDLVALKSWPLDIQMRVVHRAMMTLHGAAGYGPRKARFEAMFGRLFVAKSSQKETLGGCLFTIDAKASILKIDHE